MFGIYRISIYTEKISTYEAGTGLITPLPSDFSPQAHQSLYTTLQLHHVTLFVPTKQNQKGSQKQKEREPETKTETDRFSYTTGQLCVRLAYWFTSPTNITHSHQHSHSLTHTWSADFLTLTQQLQYQILQHTVLIAPHHSVDATDYQTIKY